MRKNKQPQQQQQNRKRHNACQNQALRARICLRTHAEGQSEVKPILP
jgi:hypothetical protein